MEEMKSKKTDVYVDTGKSKFLFKVLTFWLACIVLSVFLGLSGYLDKLPENLQIFVVFIFLGSAAFYYITLAFLAKINGKNIILWTTVVLLFFVLGIIVSYLLMIEVGKKNEWLIFDIES